MASSETSKTIAENRQLKTSYYDELSQLVREDNGYLNKTITYEYDAGGNILSRKFLTLPQVSRAAPLTRPSTGMRMKTGKTK